MTPIQQLQIRMSETREKINGMTEVRDGDADKLAERQTLTAELKAQEVELRAAIEADDDTTPETREWEDLSSRFDLGQLFEGIVEHRASSGPIAEVQKELGLAPNALPVEMLMEKRAVTPAPGDAWGRLRRQSRATCSLAPLRPSWASLAPLCRWAMPPFRS